MKLLIGAAALAAAGLVSAAPAAAENYYSLGVSFEEIGLSKNTDPVPTPRAFKDAGVPLVSATVGWKGDSWFGVEGEVAMGVSAGDPVSLNAAAGIRFSGGLYGVAHFPVSEALSVHARAGMIYQTSKLSYQGVADVVSETGLSYGVGASYVVNTDMTVRLDYTRHDIDFDYVVVEAPTATVPAPVPLFTGSSDGASTIAFSVVRAF